MSVDEIDDSEKAACSVVALVLCIPLDLWHAFVIAKVWGWTIVPIFHGPSLATSAAFGLLLLKSIVFFKMPLYELDRPAGFDRLIYEISASVTFSVFVLVIAWIWHGLAGY